MAASCKLSRFARPSPRPQHAYASDQPAVVYTYCWGNLPMPRGKKGMQARFRSIFLRNSHCATSFLEKGHLSVYCKQLSRILHQVSSLQTEGIVHIELCGGISRACFSSRA